ncbi:MAG: hypothetical protein H0V77_08020 [Actinobacteria bacterium]|nr:hypothetical protein [Actinomycetota bacterium]
MTEDLERRLEDLTARVPEGRPDVAFVVTGGGRLKRRRAALGALASIAMIGVVAVGLIAIDLDLPRGFDPTAQTAAPTEHRSDPEKSPAVAPSNQPLEPGDLKAPPPVTVRFSDQSIDLHAWTYCYGNGCINGAPPDNPPEVGQPGEVIVEFPLSEWSFTASFSPAGEECGRIQQVPLKPTGDRKFLLRPAGYAGAYDVTLFGRGNGSLSTTFRWTTPTDGPLPNPKARLAVLANPDGDIDSYGVELEVTNLARTPRRASATVTVEASSGDALSFKVTRADGRCFPEGTVYWDGPDSEGLAAAELGNQPFTYKVELMLDGERYVASATWPDDEIAGNEPSVPLHFTPNLPLFRSSTMRS